MEAFDSKSASRIAGVSLRQIQYWDERGFIRPSVKVAEGRGTRRLYSFSDLVRLRVVKDLSDHGVSLSKIRRSVAFLRRSFSAAPSPAESLRYLTDGEKIFLLTADKSKILDAMERDFVLSLRIGSLVRQVHGEVNRLRLRPAGKKPPGATRRTEPGRAPAG
ncbi:MAG TPA: MerR family transcriptional regulator [Candidatus Acidoferrales bacterium]|nr:MerR family transcriptional regulator [Candidatus Acidoferrales bacterium]